MSDVIFTKNYAEMDAEQADAALVRAQSERGIDKLFNDELAAAHASADAKEAALDAHGYDGKAPVSPGQIVGLGDFVPDACGEAARRAHAEAFVVSFLKEWIR